MSPDVRELSPYSLNLCRSGGILAASQGWAERGQLLCLSRGPWLAMGGRRSLQPPHPEVYADSGQEGPRQEGPIFELDQETGFADA